MILNFYVLDFRPKTKNILKIFRKTKRRRKIRTSKKKRARTIRTTKKRRRN